MDDIDEVYEDIFYQQEHNEEIILELVSDDDNENANEDFEEWFDAEDSDLEFSPEDINFESETFESFHERPARGGHERAVSFIRNPNNVVGRDMDMITEEIANSPSKLYALVYDDTFEIILQATNNAVDLYNKDRDETSRVQHFYLHEIKSYFGIKILFMLEKGRHVRFQDFYITRLRKAEYNMFSSIPNGKMDNLLVPVWRRYLQLVKFIDQGGPEKFVDKKTFKKSVARKHQPLGELIINCTNK